MDLFIVVLWILSTILFVASIKFKRDETVVALKKTKTMMQSMLSKVIIILLAVGFVLALLPDDMIREVLGDDGILSIVSGAVIGTITIIPAFVAFPLVGSILDNGASIVVGVSFLTTLTMVGVATFPIEAKEFGFKFAIVRNSLSFIFAIIIAIVMGVLL